MRLALSKSTIRSFCADDADLLAAHLANPHVVRYMSAIPQPYLHQHADQWIEFTSGHHPPCHFGIEVDGQLSGGIGVELGDPRTPTVSAHCGELGYWLSETHWGKGIMSEAVEAVTAWAFTELRLVRLYASVYAANPASARVLEKAGFQLEGRLRARYYRHGSFVDSLIYAQVQLPPEAEAGRRV